MGALLLSLLLLKVVVQELVVAAQDAYIPLNCTYATAPQQCSSYFYHPFDGTLEQLAKLYGVRTDSVIPLLNATGRAFAVRLPCACAPLPAAYNSSYETKVYTAQVQYTPSTQDQDFSSILRNFRETPLVLRSGGIAPGTPLTLQLGCGCLPPETAASPNNYKYVVANKVNPGDNLFTLTSYFHSNQTAIQTLNGVSDPNRIYADTVLFIPVNSISSIGQTPSVSSSASTVSDSRNSNPILGIALGVAGVVILVSLLLLGTAFCVRSKNPGCYKARAYSVNGVSGNHDVERGVLWKGVGSWMSSASLKRGTIAKNDNVKRSITLPKEANIVFDSEKPLVFAYDEIVIATDNFSQARRLGQGAFGLVFHGMLRDQEVAIKQMKATKSREFYAELKVLCKVHHTNLVELIGYSAGEENLYLVFEFAENGALSDRLHNPTSKSFAALSWNQRVQIAVDAARGLEYIHEHTKAHYVHRDVKTSNILLDGYFRAKIADFGLAKLVEQSADGGGGLTTRVVGTFGYLAPEYVRDGYATAKSDAYAFGVVLMELITGSEAISKNKSSVYEGNNEKRSLISLMLSVLEEKDAYGHLQHIVDPLLCDNYSKDGAYRMALLSKACVEEDPGMRPDMRQVVLTLSQILLSSIEWEAAFAGNSQVFSGLVQGR